MESKTLKYIIEFDAKHADKVTRQIKNIGGSMEKFGKQTEKTAKSTKGLASSMGGLMTRALLVIPVWMALRSVYMAFFNTIRQGLKHIRDLDKAMARAAAVTHGVDDKSGFIAKLKGDVRGIAMDTGTTVDKVAEAFYRFGTAGLSATESVEGMKLAIKTSIAMMGDSTQTARTLADVYNLMKHNIKGAVTEQQAMQKIASTMAVLWTQNAFELNEFNTALKTVTGVAKNMDLTLDELMGTLAVSHTLMQRGGTAGTQLARSFMMMVKNGEAVNTLLGEQVNLSKENAFGLFVKVLKEINGQYTDGLAKSQALFDIFGMKGTKVTAALTANFGKWIGQLEELQNMPLEERMEKLNELYELQLNTIDKQLGRMRELTNVTFEAFVTGVTGADNYVGALKKINSFIEDHLILNAVRLGVMLNEYFATLPTLAKGIADMAQGKGFTNKQRRSSALFEKAREQGLLGEWNPGLSVNENVNLQKSSFKKNYGEPFEGTDAVGKMKIMVKELQMADNESFDWLETTEKIQYRFALIRNDASDLNDLLVKIGDAAGDTSVDLERISIIMAGLKSSVASQLMDTMLLAQYGFDSIQIAERRVAIALQDLKITGNKKSLEQELLNLQKARNQEILKSSEAVMGAARGSISDYLKGKSTLSEASKGFLQKGRDIQIDKASDALSKLFFGRTGIASAFAKGAITTYNAILRGFTDGASVLSPSAKVATIGGRTVTFGDTIQSVGGFWSESSFGGAIQGAGTFGDRMMNMGTKSGLPGFGKDGSMGKTMGGVGGGTRGQLFSTVASSVMSGVGAGQAGGAGVGTMAGLGALGMGLGGGGLGFLGASAGMAGMIGGLLGPVGLALMVGSMIWQANKKPPEWQKEETRTQTMQIGSRIDITNSHLEWVNRNLVAMRQELTFILPRSAYFSENDNVSQNFSQSVQRGGL